MIFTRFFIQCVFNDPFEPKFLIFSKNIKNLDQILKKQEILTKFYHFLPVRNSTQICYHGATMASKMVRNQ